jgi:GNAT superfamily N-acetyltransferase
MDGQPRIGARGLESIAGDSHLTISVEPLEHGKIPAWMFFDHYTEVGSNKDVQKLKPDWKFYFQEYKAGRLICVVARNEVWDVVGYMSMFIRQHPHYSDCKVAFDDAHYLMPAYRGKGNGAAMIAFAEKAAREAGAVLFSMRCKADQPHGEIFEKLGYKLTDLVYLKDIRDAKPA